MGIIAEIDKRFTAHSFNGKIIPDESINTILEAGRLAPSAKNRQPWRFIVCRSEQKKADISSACYGDEKLVNASHIIAACTTNISYTLPNGQESYPLDIAMAVSYMDLQAVHEGCNTVIYSIYNEEKVKSILTVPYSMRVVLLLALGYSGSVVTGSHSRLSISRIREDEHW